MCRKKKKREKGRERQKRDNKVIVEGQEVNKAKSKDVALMGTPNIELGHLECCKFQKLYIPFTNAISSIYVLVSSDYNSCCAVFLTESD